MNKSTSFVIWNIRGTNNDNFRRELIHTHSPYMVVLLKTRIKVHATSRDEFNFSDMVEVPDQGWSGGLIILWLDNFVAINSLTQPP